MDVLCKKMESETIGRQALERYSRQIILPGVGVEKQLLLAKSSVLVVGCGGLGCPAALYLAAGGVGTIGLVDHDTVETSNLHRQILHKERTVGMPKAESASESLSALNSSIEVKTHNILFDSNSALQIISDYDIILDCTDNAATRYLLNDACVILKKPLVSGSALRFDGQLTVYNWKNGPCYRCLYPSPVPATLVTNCAEGGVLGPIVGTIGSLQALEAMKIVMGMEPAYGDKMLLFDGELGNFRSIKLRPKQLNCDVCGENPKISELIDYIAFCGSGPSDKEEKLALLPLNKRLSSTEYKQLLDQSHDHLLIDVRPENQLSFGKLPAKNYLNIPFEKLEKSFDLINEKSKEVVLFVCRRGNDSQRSVAAFEKYLATLGKSLQVKDIIGGMHSWSLEVDPSFPIY
ncbi:adenylyltransferase and sulfurtransferase MOCS3-like isoform X2 [Artemia franciscana]|uniref:adenylyltransferase and sulfurtransferase MOCS3-like isoform X2 n=1 Tax=Artemia franciscana TaxID=6661 RepID=UPI0032DAEDC7